MLILVDCTSVFAANLWNGFDLVFILIYANYLCFRLYGLHRGQDWARDLGTDILAMGMLPPRRLPDPREFADEGIAQVLS